MKARALPAHLRRQARHSRRRKLSVGLACALWLVGFDLVPSAHIALHAQLGAHDHGHGAGDTHATDAHAAQDAAPQPARSFSAWRDHGATEPDATKRHADQRAPHAHGSHAHPHATSTPHADASDPSPGDHASQGASPLDHGEGSLAHRDLAALLPLPGLPPVPEAPFMGWLAAGTRRELASNQRPATTRARAPPERTDLRHPI